MGRFETGLNCEVALFVRLLNNGSGLYSELVLSLEVVLLYFSNVCFIMIVIVWCHANDIISERMKIPNYIHVYMYLICLISFSSVLGPRKRRRKRSKMKICPSKIWRTWHVLATSITRARSPGTDVTLSSAMHVCWFIEVTMTTNRCSTLLCLAARWPIWRKRKGRTMCWG